MPAAPRVRRAVHLVHRWVGVAACLLMVLWLGSGMVMLFVGFPKLLPHERLASLPRLAGPGCCVSVDAALQASPSPATVQQVTLTSIGGRPHYRLREGDGSLHTVDATSGRRVDTVAAADALRSAQAFLPGPAAEVQGPLDEDRWTHARGLDAHRPLYVVQLHDAHATRLYVSSRTGEVVLDAPAAQRRWNHVGAWLHWLYLFRDGSRDPVWTWLVTGLSAVGTLGAATGALVGVWRWRFRGRYRSGARTPYRDAPMRWHHRAGLAFGAVLLAWVFSGLMSMNPLGLFDARTPPDEAAFRGGTPGAMRIGLDVGDALDLLAAAGFEACELDWQVLAGQPHLLARDAAGASRLVVADGAGWARTARGPRPRCAPPRPA